MREILFKAKTTVKENREFNNVWVKGNLIISNNKYYIHPIGNIVRVESELGKIIVMHEVDTSTICQYTELTGKNGNKIWENDIVRIVGHASDVNGVYKIIFDEINHCWALERSYDYPRSYFTFSDLNGFAEDCEVIGNIFDNLELINE